MTLYHAEYQKSVWVLFQRGLPFIRLSSGFRSCSADELSIDMKEQLKSDSRLKHLPSFVILGSNDQLCDIALKMRLLFASTYLCEAGFSRLTALKTKYRNRAQIEDDLKILSLHDGSPLGDRSPSHCACVILRHCRLLSTAKPRAHASQRQIRFQSWRKATKGSFLKT